MFRPSEKALFILLQSFDLAALRVTPMVVTSWRAFLSLPPSGNLAPASSGHYKQKAKKHPLWHHGPQGTTAKFGPEPGGKLPRAWRTTGLFVGSLNAVALSVRASVDFWTSPRFGSSSRSSLTPGAYASTVILPGTRRQRPTSPARILGAWGTHLAPRMTAKGTTTDLTSTSGLLIACGKRLVAAAVAACWVIPSTVDFLELAVLHPSEPPVAAAFDTAGSAARKVRRVCENASCRSVCVGVC